MSAHFHPLLIRADAGPGIGVGHVMRCLALAQAWRLQDGEVAFLSMVGPRLEERLRYERIALTSVQSGNVRDVLKASVPGQWVVLDGYGFGAEWQGRLREEGRRVLAVDDYHHLNEYKAHVVLNQNIRAANTPYDLPQDSLLLAGTEYALIRGEFLGKGRNGERACRRRVFVTLGGADVFGITPLVLHGLALVRLDGLEVRVAVGPEDPRIEEIRALAASLPYAVEALPAPDMAEQMAWADLAVTAAGVTCWELACMGVPMIVITVADNQGENAAGLAEAGVGLDLGSSGEVSPEKVAGAVGALLCDQDRLDGMSKAGWRLVDGRGAERVVAIMKALSTARLDVAALLRPAGPEDCRAVWRLSNHPSVRANSFSRNPIPYDEHCAWYAGMLADSDSVLYVVEVGGVVLGQVRYDRHGDTALLSLSVLPAFWGKGLGQGMLRHSLPLVRRKLCICSVEAEVLANNAPSLACFRRAGYVEAGFGGLHDAPSLRFVRGGLEREDE